MSKEFEKEIAQLAKKIEQTKDYVKNEQMTKQSFVLPIFRVLGYDCSDPREIVAEFTADIKSKNMDKVDYVIMENDKPVILVECKHWSEKLENHVGQLFKYFVSTPAKFAILTNGIEYLFYTDLEKPNILDKTPFLKIDLLDLKAHAIKELAKFRKDSFDISEIFTTAEELKYTNSIIELFAAEYGNPSNAFVKHVLSEVYEGKHTDLTIEKFRPIIKNSFMQFVNELISDRLEAAAALSSEVEKPPIELEMVVTTDDIDEEERATEPTEEEIQAFYIVKSILAEVTELDQISYKDTVNYFSILYGSKVTKWICRLELKRSSKFIIFPKDITTDRIALETINDLYRHRELIIKSVKQFLK